MRLIDADELMKRIDDSARNDGLNLTDYRKIIRWVAKAPIIDAVEVVRCKDCKHRGMEGTCPMCHDEYDVDEGWYTIDNAKDNGFCDRGERRDKNADD